MNFSIPPKASESRAWATLQGCSLLPNTGDGFTAPETRGGFDWSVAIEDQAAGYSCGFARRLISGTF